MSCLYAVLFCAYYFSAIIDIPYGVYVYAVYINPYGVICIDNLPLHDIPGTKQHIIHTGKAPQGILCWSECHLRRGQQR